MSSSPDDHDNDTTYDDDEMIIPLILLASCDPSVNKMLLFSETLLLIRSENEVAKSGTRHQEAPGSYYSTYSCQVHYSTASMMMPLSSHCVVVIMLPCSSSYIRYFGIVFIPILFPVRKIRMLLSARSAQIPVRLVVVWGMN